MTSLLTFLDLTITAGPEKGMRYSIPEGMFRVIGRQESTLNPEQQELLHKALLKTGTLERGPNIILNDPLLHPAHAVVLYDAKNSLWIDLLEEKSKMIHPGDSIQFGNTWLKVS